MPVDYSKFDEIDYDALLMTESEEKEEREETRKKNWEALKKASRDVMMATKMMKEKGITEDEIKLTPVEKSKMRAIVQDYERRGINILDLSEPPPKMKKLVAEAWEARYSLFERLLPEESKEGEGRKLEEQAAQESWEIVRAFLKKQ
jgi:hypothetical protein